MSMGLRSLLMVEKSVLGLLQPDWMMEKKSEEHTLLRFIFWL